MKKAIITIITILIFIIFLASIYKITHAPLTISINNKTIKVELAQTLEEQVKGLSGRDKLAKDSGLLFIYPDKKIRAFWMKDMKFPLDIIWIKDDLVVAVIKDLPPEGSFPNMEYRSPEAINAVLEVNKGFTDYFNIKAGDKVEYGF